MVVSQWKIKFQAPGVSKMGNGHNICMHLTNNNGLEEPTLDLQSLKQIISGSAA